jgi:carboxylesterase type B
MYGADADAYLALYPVSSVADIKAVGGKVAREGGLETNARTCGQLQAKHNTSKTYIDMFSKKHSYAPGVRIADQDVATVGAYHTADIPFWFGTLDVFNSLRTTRAWTPADRELSAKMMDSLLAFAATGNPSGWPSTPPSRSWRRRAPVATASATGRATEVGAQLSRASVPGRSRRYWRGELPARRVKKRVKYAASSKPSDQAISATGFAV